MSSLRRLFRRRKLRAELDSVLRFHIEQKTADLIAKGIEPGEARRRAMTKLGGIEAIKQEYRESRPSYFLESVLQDARYAVRMLRKSPGFTTVAILTLALGIGANTAIFSAVNGILIEPLPYAHSGRMIEIGSSGFYPSGTRFTDGPISLPDIKDIQAQCPAIGPEVAYSEDTNGLVGTVLGGSFPVIAGGFPVSGNFFTALGVRPMLGRPILPSDTETGNDHIAVLSYGLWEDGFDADPKAIGKTIWLKAKPYTVIGVMPPQFNMPTGSWTLSSPRLVIWAPITPREAASAANRGAGDLDAIFWLRPGATLREANAELGALSDRLASLYKPYKKVDKGWRLTAERETTIQIGSALPFELLILLGAVGLVLLIACINVSAMLLARSWTRHREVAIRAALGATRGRVVRQFLVESLLLSLAGGALGLLVAVWAIPALRAIAPADTPRLDQLRLDTNVLWFALGASVLGGIVFGLMPAFAASDQKIGATLKEGMGSLLEGSSARGPRRLRGALAVTEVALAVILTAGATLVARSLQKMMAVPLGYRTEHVLTVQPALYGTACQEAKPALCLAAAREILRRLRALPGVEAATVALARPLDGGDRAKVRIQGQPEPSGTFVALDQVMPGYFRVMGIPLLAGRDFTDSDISDFPRVVIVSRAFAERFFPGADPLGQRFSMIWGKTTRPQMEIVGEVGDIHERTITSQPDPEFYMPPATEMPWLAGRPTYFIGTAGDPLVLTTLVRQQIKAVDKDAPIYDLETFDRIVATEEAQPRFRAALLGAFGFLGLLLATVGIYGVISYTVSRRTREIGLRMALGAQRADVLAMILREGMLLATAGIVLGICGALALTRLLRGYLFEITPTDPVTFMSVALLLAVAALLACYVPARRAMRVDPMASLRNE